MPNIKYQKEEHIGIITFSRPEAFNALNSETLSELDALLAKIEADRELYVVILTGEGKAFIAGADIAEMAEKSLGQGKAFAELGQRVLTRLQAIEPVTIAALNGFTLGGGLEVAMSCDIRIAGERIKLGQPEVSLGITPGFAGTQRLPRLIGPAKAKELIFTGKPIDGNEAKRIGLVNDVAEDALAAAKKMAADICKQAPIAVKYAKQAIDKGLESSFQSGQAIEAQLFGMCFATTDQKDGMRAFLNKEKASYNNK
ncbi:MAG: hypothetical protein CR995_00015 [Clostridiales bacterium]|nr:MAG: hypothetical protein CR995_00015 [Clostridiales bacterium]